MKKSLSTVMLLFAIAALGAYGHVNAGSQQIDKAVSPTVDYRFSSGHSANNISFELNANKPYVPVRVNGSAPVWFILDTGSIIDAVDSDIAKRFGISSTTNGEATGGGEGSISLAAATGVSLGLDGLELSKRNIEVLSIDSAIAFSEGRRVSGLLGYEFLSRFVVEIDYAKAKINIYDPQEFRYSGKGEIIPLQMVRGNIMISASLITAGKKPISGDFLVDTGWRSALSLNAPFVESQKLLTTTKTIAATTGVGVGGPTIDAVGRVEELHIGRYTVKSPVTNFSAAKHGILAQGDMTGIIGGDILRRFKVIFDYSRQHMILEPNTSFNNPYESDMSGLFVTAEGADLKTVRISQVTDNSPASHAGLLKNDIIQSINGRPAADFTLEQIRQMFKVEGKELVLGINRGDQKINVTLKLERLI